MSTFFYPANTVVGQLSGPDAARFLQARITNDVSTLPVGSAMFAAALTAQGKIQALPNILRKSDSEFIVIHEGLDFEELSRIILQFKVADRVEFDERDDCSVLHLVGDNLKELFPFDFDLSSPSLFIESGELIAHPRDRGFGLGIDVVGPTAELVKIKTIALENGFTEAADQLQTFRRIKAGKLSFADELQNMFFPECQLANVVSTTKGCYVGQEAVEMSLARGRLPAELRLFSVQSDRPINDEIHFTVEAEKPPRITVCSSVFNNADQELAGVLRVAKPDLLNEQCKVTHQGNIVEIRTFEASL